MTTRLSTRSDQARVTAAILAGGAGHRMGGDRPKQLLELAGRTVLEHSLATFCACPEVDEVLLLLPEPHVAEAEHIASAVGYAKVTRVLPGGTERSDTSWRAIQALDQHPDSEIVLLHDAARPLVEPQAISACITAAAATGAASVAVPASDTIVESMPGPSPHELGAVSRMPDRTTLRRMQTPQGFRLGVLRRAHEAARNDPVFQATDDCGVVVNYLPETSVALVAGTETNIKITHPGDLAVATALLQQRTNPQTKGRQAP